MIPEVTVVVVAHSVREELARCLESVRRHSAMPVDVILVDNASTDGTVPWMREAHPEVTVVELPANVGVAARDHGLRRAQGRYTMFLDSDAQLTDGALPAMVSALDAHPGWGLVGPRLVGDDGELQLSSRRFPPRLLPLLRRPPLARFFEDSAVVRRHLMADDDHERVRPVLYVLGACPALSHGARPRGRAVRRPGLPGLGRRRLVHPHPRRGRGGRLLPRGDRRALVSPADTARAAVARSLATAAGPRVLPAHLRAAAARAAAPAGRARPAERRLSGGPEVSVVIVSWQARAHLLACLESVTAETALSQEVIVVDDGSTDGTAEAVAQAFPAVRLLAKPRREGLVAGRNAALSLVSGRRVLMLDADTRLRAGAVKTLAAALDADPGTGLVGPRLVYPDGRLQLSCRRYPPLLLPFVRRGPWQHVDPDPPSHRHHLMKDFDHATARPVVWVAGAAQMWRADLPGRIGRYDRRISSYGGEDIDWCLRVWRAGLEVHYVPDAEVVHVSQQVTRRRPLRRESLRAFLDYYYVQAKHRGLRRDPRLERALG